MGNKGIKLGLIGSGARGRGAVMDALAANPEVVLWSLSGVFPDHVADAQKALKAEMKSGYEVTPERAFVGFDSYHDVLASGVDAVIITSPPAFHPEHFAAAVDAGKHVFMEKPAACDPTGV